jgi:hypothetical protein
LGTNDTPKKIAVVGGSKECLRQKPGGILGIEGGSLASDPIAKPTIVESLRRDERGRVEEMMSQAKTDFELWDIMMKEVFSMVYRLGIAEDQESDCLSKSKIASRKKKTVGAKRAADDTITSATPRLSMEVYGPLYPAYLLNGLRLFDQAFSRPSPLSLSILPRVKQLGLASYTLGVSTPFYNSLMAIQWRRYGDVRQVLDLLEEMRHAGLCFDEGSLRILHSIESYMRPYSDERNSPFLQELMGLPEFGSALATRFLHWVSAIDVGISDRKREFGY